MKKSNNTLFLLLVEMIVLPFMLIALPFYSLFSYIKDDVINFNLKSLRKKRINDLNSKSNTLFYNHFVNTVNKKLLNNEDFGKKINSILYDNAIDDIKFK
jgi:hypothetical protein